MEEFENIIVFPDIGVLVNVKERVIEFDKDHIVITRANLDKHINELEKWVVDNDTDDVFQIADKKDLLEIIEKLRRLSPE